MADIEKVIKALEVCSKIDDSCKNCPYSKYKDVEDCSNTLLKDALELLKEQQKTRLEIAHEIVSGSILMYQGKELVRCKDCKHGGLYCTEDTHGETLYECCLHGIDEIEVHKQDWYCADGERK